MNEFIKRDSKTVVLLSASEKFETSQPNDLFSHALHKKIGMINTLKQIDVKRYDFSVISKTALFE